MAIIDFKAAAAGLALLALGATSALADTKISRYFPLPLGFSTTGPNVRDSLLQSQAHWLENGLDNVKKARASETSEEKIKEFDAIAETATKELELAKNNDANKDIQVERKRAFLLAINQWINELERQATQQMKAAILGDGMEAMVAQKQAASYSEMAEKLEHAKQDTSIENWAKAR